MSLTRMCVVSVIILWFLRRLYSEKWRHTACRHSGRTAAGSSILQYKYMLLIPTSRLLHAWVALSCKNCRFQRRTAFPLGRRTRTGRPPSLYFQPVSRSQSVVWAMCRGLAGKTYHWQHRTVSLQDRKKRNWKTCHPPVPTRVAVFIQSWAAASLKMENRIWR